MPTFYKTLADNGIKVTWSLISGQGLISTGPEILEDTLKTGKRLERKEWVWPGKSL